MVKPASISKLPYYSHIPFYASMCVYIMSLREALVSQSAV